MKRFVAALGTVGLVLFAWIGNWEPAARPLVVMLPLIATVVLVAPALSAGRAAIGWALLVGIATAMVAGVAARWRIPLNAEILLGLMASTAALTVGGSRCSERMSRACACALLLLGSAPLWAAPLALAVGQDGLVQALVRWSPLTHLAVAAECDWLRLDVFYRHSPLAGRPIDYPAVSSVLAGYAGLTALTLSLFALRARRAPEIAP